MNMFQFAPLQSIEEHNFHNVLEDFYKMGIRGLVRENLQNSLDARLAADQPVRVKIAFGDIPTAIIPGVNELRARIHCLAGKNQYSQATIKRMQEAIEVQTVKYISFEDSQTKGLTGAQNGQSNDPNDTFGVYAYNKGVHGVESDPEKEKVRGGSHGIGKIASNSASDIYLMYFANCDATGNQHLGGTIQLIEHQYQGAYYRATGYFAEARENQQQQIQKFPYVNHFHEVFAKKTRGLKIIVPFLREGFADEAEIIKTVCDSFLLAIVEHGLIVEINDKVIDAKTIAMYVEQYYPTDVAELKKAFTPLYLQTYQQANKQPIEISNGEQTFHFQLYFNYDEAIPTGRMAIFRTVGMKIADYKVAGNVRKPFNAVLIGGGDEDVYLKSLENESHTDISTEHIKDAKTKRLANKFIRQLNHELDTIIKAEIKRQNPVDGMIDTSDILYTTEVQFKKQIEKALGAVTINTGKKMMKTTDAATPGKQTKKSERAKKVPGLQKKQNPPKPNLQVRDDEPKKDRYRVQPNLVQRVMLGEQELLHFDFKQEVAFKKANTCDIAFEIIDGMGQKLAFDLAHHYVQVVDHKTGQNYPFVANKLCGVTIADGEVHLQIRFKANYNKALKFNYLVEV
ncbi:MAG: hypothetical protein ACRC17_00635 [Culicoidibacterales bacterium]